VEYSRRHNKDKDLEALQKVIDSFSDDVSGRISQLDQTIRDLLQLASIQWSFLTIKSADVK